MLFAGPTSCDLSEVVLYIYYNNRFEPLIYTKYIRGRTTAFNYSNKLLKHANYCTYRYPNINLDNESGKYIDCSINLNTKLLEFVMCIN